MILIGHALEQLRTLPDESVQCCVSSPPYWGLRDYGVDGQLGLEKTPAEFVANMTAVFEEVRRVLRKDGTCWVNMGDSYAAQGGDHSLHNSNQPNVGAARCHANGSGDKGNRRPAPGLKPKDLVGIPWRLAFALQDAGWYLRSDIIWAKPNPMPESVRDRPTKAHEYIFLLTKSAKYFYNADAIAEDIKPEWVEHYRKHAAKPTIVAKSNPDRNDNGTPDTQCGFSKPGITTRNARTVWTIATQAYAEAHFATFPEELPRRCILAGSREGDTILDPFGGSGTTGAVATELGRDYILIELNPEYAELARKRIASKTPGFRFGDAA